MGYLLLKTLHILSATILFGTGLGTAFHFWATNRRGEIQAIAAAARTTVLADWCFTAPAGLAQPLTGLALAHLAGYELAEPWLVASVCLYLLAGASWVIVVVLQIRMARLAARAAAENRALPEVYAKLMRAWFWLGWPAFLALVAVFWLMVAKPDLR